jgi:DNA primase
MPLDWNELRLAVEPAHFTITNAFPRLVTLDADPWRIFGMQRHRSLAGKG